MFRRIVIASDSFKGSLSSLEVGEAAAAGIRRVYPACETICIQVADGGEGTATALLEAADAKTTDRRHTTAHVTVSDPLGRPVRAKYHITAENTAIMEMAAASGITLLSPEERNPMETSTFGTGEMILDAIGRGCRKFVIGIGGSATNDGGSGMLEALGAKFIGQNGDVIERMCGKRLSEIYDIDCSQIHPALKDSEFTVACDVESPFCGPEGATRVFGPQKGADADDVETLEKGMQAFNGIIKLKTGKDLSQEAGSGAAGGMGGAFTAFLGARLSKGTDLILETLGFSQAIRGADLIITGEGRIDGQSAKGKVISGVARMAKEQGIPVVAIAGIVDITQDEVTALGLTGTFAIAPRPETENGLRNAMRPEAASENIAITVVKVLESLSPSSCHGNL